MLYALWLEFHAESLTPRKGESFLVGESFY
jgi:hypothetical protein